MLKLALLKAEAELWNRDAGKGDVSDSGQGEFDHV